MTLTEIENLSAAELKEQRATLIEAAKASPADELAARYVQARTDAKLRDEKLAEQGTTITLLQESLNGCKASLAEESNRAANVEVEIIRMNKLLGVANEKVNDLAAEMRAVKVERDAAVLLAKSRRTALADVMKVISPVLAAE